MNSSRLNGSSTFSSLFSPQVLIYISWVALRLCCASRGETFLTPGWGWEMCRSSISGNSISSVSTLSPPLSRLAGLETSQLPEETCSSLSPSFCSSSLAWFFTRCQSRKFRAFWCLTKFRPLSTRLECRSLWRTWWSKWEGRCQLMGVFEEISLWLGECIHWSSSSQHLAISWSKMSFSKIYHRTWK
jgi:hypothetical protein